MRGSKLQKHNQRLRKKITDEELRANWASMMYQPKSEKEAAKTMAATEKKLTKQKRTADEERKFQRLMKKGKGELDTKKGKADAGKLSAAMGGLIGPSYRHGHKDLRKNNK